MIKYVLMAGCAMVASSAFAQTAPSEAQTVAPTQQESGVQTPEADGQAATAPDASAQGAANADANAANGQLMAQVDREFPTYDADKSGGLNEQEFDGWMVKLRQASDPSFSAATPANQSWLKQVFKMADKDQDQSVSKIELAALLTGQAG